MTIVRILYRSTLLLLAAAAAAGSVRAAETVTVVASRVNLRIGPGIRYQVISQLPKGAQGILVGREPGWLKVEITGAAGYLSDLPGLVRITGEPAGTAGRTAARTEQLKEWQRKAENIQEKVTASQNELEAIAQKEQAVLARFESGGKELDRVRRQVHAAETALGNLQAETAAARQRAAALQDKIRSEKEYAGRRLVALYKLGRLGRIQLLASAGSFTDFVTRKAALKRILVRDESLLGQLSQDQAELKSTLERLDARSAEEQSLKADLTARLNDLKAGQAAQGILLARIRNEKDLQAAAIEELKQAGRDLDAAIEHLQAEISAAPAPDAAGGPAGRDFDALKGLLSWPVRGKIISFFGPYRDDKFNMTNFQSGIDIQAERGEPVRAVGGGVTIFSDWFKGFGNMIIVDHGNHYYTVYAHLEEVFKVKGDRVEKGEVIATVGDSGSLSGPALHFEVRHHGKPMDPLHWIKNG